MGMRCSDTAVIHFDDVRVPADHIIGEEGMGFTYQMMQVSVWFRLLWMGGLGPRWWSSIIEWCWV